MKAKIPVLLALASLLLVQLACNLPAQTDVASQIPAPNQTLTALFAVTPVEEATPTLPLIVTATQQEPATAAPTETPPPAPVDTQPAAPAATATTAPTATFSGPAPTATIPNSRPRGNIVAKYMRTPPVIDGDWSEWKDIAREYPATSVVFGRENWTDQDDLAGSFYVGWDENNLYLAVKVRDDVYVQNATGANIFKGDSIEIMLDTNLVDDYYVAQLNADDYQLGISPGRITVGENMEAYLWYPSSKAGPVTDIYMAAIQQPGVYRLEAAIPWTVFGGRPNAGDRMGFVISISDNDSPGTEIQQSMVSNVPGRRLTDPTTWGDIHFTR
jgi:hypothetical protein